MNYSYVCRRDPEHTLIVPGKFGDMMPPLTVCPECGEQARRKYTAPSVQYRGQGFTGAARRRRK